MANVNKVILIGNVTRDPEVKFTPKGSAVTDLGLAINRTYSVEGEKREETTFVDVELWGRLAEIAGEYAKKGRPIYIEGRLRMDNWEDKQSGQKRSRLRVVGENLQLLGGRPGGSSGGGGGDYESEGGAPQRSSSRPSSQRPSAPPAASEDDDIPF
ncbi:MAG: single-stranded DNA-binding protein [Terrimicrobiaceae bacterium]|nr:single-stranded DNA-binding protein [Terrimicrobiaceae bacterium]